MFNFLKSIKKNIDNELEAIHTVRILKEKYNLNDNLLLNNFKNIDKKPLTFLKGRVVLVDDETGKVVFDEPNIIVLRGRTFALEKMFDTQLSSTLNGTKMEDETKEKLTPNISAGFLSDNYDTYGYDQTDLSTKKVCLFRVGNGGCVAPSDPFNVIPIQYPDARVLANEIPFRFADETGGVGDDGITYDVNDSNYKYADIRDYNITKLKDNSVEEDTDKTTRKAFFAKRISGISWVDNPNTHDEIAVKLTLEISDDDFRTTFNEDTGKYKRHTMINELGLCIANDYSSSTGTTNQTKMENRVVPTKVIAKIKENSQFKEAIEELATKKLTIYYKDLLELENTYPGIIEVAGDFSMGLTNDIDDETIELATAIHFESEPYYNELKSSHIYYYIYA